MMVDNMQANLWWWSKRHSLIAHSLSHTPTIFSLSVTSCSGQSKVQTEWYVDLFLAAWRKKSWPLFFRTRCIVFFLANKIVAVVVVVVIDWSTLGSITMLLCDFSRRPTSKGEPKLNQAWSLDPFTLTLDRNNAFGPINNWPVCSLILHCGQLILRTISKIVTRQAILTCQDVANKSATNWQQVVVMEFGKHDTTQPTQRTFACANLLRTCYGETGVMDFGLY